MKYRMLTLLAMTILATEPAARAGQDAVAAADVAKSMSALLSEVQAALGKDKIHTQFDMLRRLQAYGVTFQPTLLAPEHLAPQLSDACMRHYAGMKMFDTIYAATFMKREETAACVATIEEIQEALELRSHADLSGAFFTTLKKAVAEPESMDVRALLEQLSADYVNEIPAMMSSEPTAAYLIEGLFGFTIEAAYVMGHFFRTGQEAQMREGMRKHADINWLYTILDVFEAFNRMDERIRVAGQTEERLAVIRQMIAAIEAEQGGGLTQEDRQQRWSVISRKIASIRAAILSPENAE